MAQKLLHQTELQSLPAYSISKRDELIKNELDKWTIQFDIEERVSPQKIQLASLNSQVWLQESAMN